VASVTPKGCFVHLARGVKGRVMIKQLADRFVTDVKGEFPQGRVVEARVTAVDAERGQTELTLKHSLVPSPLPPELTHAGSSRCTRPPTS
jgi:ribosomal protein S1